MIICKRKAILILSLVCVLSLSGCGNNKSRMVTTEKTVLPIQETTEASATEVATTEASTELQSTAEPAVVVEPEDTTQDLSNGDIDIDLTLLSSTMVYAEVYNMVTKPEDYVGKTIRVQGPYSPLFYEETEGYYHYVIISDATACCQNGIEFIWGDGSHVYPDEYPAEGTEVQITGTYGSYVELDYTYYYIAVDEIEIVQ